MWLHCLHGCTYGGACERGVSARGRCAGVCENQPFLPGPRWEPVKLGLCSQRSPYNWMSCPTSLPRWEGLPLLVLRFLEPRLSCWPVDLQARSLAQGGPPTAEQRGIRAEFEGRSLSVGCHARVSPGSGSLLKFCTWPWYHPEGRDRHGSRTSTGSDKAITPSHALTRGGPSTISCKSQFMFLALTAKWRMLIEDISENTEKRKAKCKTTRNLSGSSFPPSCSSWRAHPCLQGPRLS